MEIDIFDDDELNQKVAKSIENNIEELPIDEEQFVAELKEAYKTQKEAAQGDFPESKLAQNAWNKVTAQLSGSSNSGETFEGIILASDEPNDMNKNLREEKKQKYEDEGQEALKSGDIHLIKDEDDIDGYRKLVFDRSNQELIREEIDELPPEAMQVASDAWIVPIRTEARYENDQEVGEPVPENNYLRTLFGIGVPKESDRELKPFAMSVSGSEKPLMDVPFNELVEFEAVKKQNEKKRKGVVEHQLAFVGDEYRKTDRDDPEIQDIIENKMNQYIVEMPELDEFERSHDDWNDYAIVKGMVSNINLDTSGSSNRSIVIEKEQEIGSGPLGNGEDNTQRSVYCSLADHVDIDFGEGTLCYVIGSTFRPPSDDGEVNDPMMTARGLYVVPGRKIATSDEVEDVSEEDLDFGDSEDQDESDDEEEFSEEGADFDLDNDDTGDW